MPDMGGIETARHIRTNPGTARLPVIAMSADTFDGEATRLAEAGMDDYVAKPIRPNELAKALSRTRTLEDRGTPRTQGASANLDASAVESLRDLGGEEFVAEVIDTFLSDAPALVETLRTTYEQGHADGLRRAAHTLKSNGQTFGAGRFSKLCRELELRARNDELDGAAELVDRIEREYAALEQTLAALRATAAS